MPVILLLRCCCSSTTSLLAGLYRSRGFDNGDDDSWDGCDNRHIARLDWEKVDNNDVDEGVSVGLTGCLPRAWLDSVGVGVGV